MSVVELFSLKRIALFIRIEKDSINRMKYNARWLKEKTPELIDAEARRKELIVQEKEIKRTRARLGLKCCSGFSV